MRVPADRIAVVRVSPGLREMLCAVPALRALRGTAPRGHIALIGLPSSRWVLERFPEYVDELIEFPGFPGLIPPGERPDPGRIVRFLSEMQEQSFDLAIQLQGDDFATANAFTTLLDARRTGGMVGPRETPPDKDLFVDHVEGEPEALRLVRILENIGARPTRDAELEFIIGDDEAEHDREPGSYVCVEGLDDLEDVFAERSLDVADSSELELGPRAALLRDAALVVCRDGDSSQLAEAVATPSVVVFEPDGDIRRWGPVDAERHRCLGGTGDEVETAEIVAAVDEILAQRMAA